MKDTLSLATHGPVIPVIVLQRIEHAVPMAEALLAGGVKVLEITLRTAVALQCIEAIAKAVPQAIVGAGTMIEDTIIEYSVIEKTVVGADGAPARCPA